MKTRYYSKVDFWLGATIVGLSFLNIINIFKWIPDGLSLITFINIMVTVLCIWIFLGTYYEFKEDHLLIKSGPSKYKILYSEIKKLTYKRNIVASSALSIDRIEILCFSRFGGYISPKDKEEFMEILKSKCINIKS